jgi:hypothetical protein
LVLRWLRHYLVRNYLFDLGVKPMDDGLPESHYVEAYLVDKPCEVIAWMEDVEAFIHTEAYS